MLSLPLRKSRYASLLLAIVHLATLAVLSQSGMILPLKLLLGSLVAVSYWRSDLLQTGLVDGLQAIEIHKDFSILEGRRQRLCVSLPRVQFYSEWLIVLRFAADPEARQTRRFGRHLSVQVTLLPDSLSEEDARRLRCYLHYPESR